MNKRRPVQDKHERGLVDAFIGWWGQQTGEQFQVIARPNPPDAIVQSEERTTWIEVADTFFSEAWAEDRYSSATPGEEYRPMISGLHVNMDAQFAERFVALLGNKLTKKSYAESFQKHGPGILLVGMQSPWFDSNTCELMREFCAKADWSANRGYFARVFISFSSLNRQVFEEWK